jgi:hypothetical protein
MIAVTAVALLRVAGSGSAETQKPSGPPIEARDPWTSVQLIRPEALAAMLKATKIEQPVLLHVGFKPLYRGGAIPGSRYVGPGSRPDGIAQLKRAVKDMPRDRSIVIYCGCCPWDHCPNMRPAFRALRGMGFKNVRALYVAKDLDDDWASRGFPIEKPKR